jgi:hypothetical protein
LFRLESIVGFAFCSTHPTLLVAGLADVPKIRALFEAIYLVGLRKAGMPEE